ncbi:hypothetical protein VTK56DRAFT_7584 [Thermocarpiscus australiensis]
MNTAGVVVLVIVLALIAGAIGWVVFTRVRAQRLGLPPPPLKSYFPFLHSASPSYGPSPAPGGLFGWINDRIRLFRYRNTRTATGAYEGSSYNAGYSSTTTRGGFGPLDPDDAWDARVGHGPDGYHPYEEERELGLVAPPAGGFGHGQPQDQAHPQGEGYQMNEPVGPGEEAEEEEERRGRTRSRSPARGHQGGANTGNPFADDAEPSNVSLRGVSPRPMDASFAGRMAARGDEDRKSIFREEV